METLDLIKTGEGGGGGVRVDEWMRLTRRFAATNVVNRRFIVARDPIDTR